MILTGAMLLVPVSMVAALVGAVARGVALTVSRLRASGALVEDEG